MSIIPSDDVYDVDTDVDSDYSNSVPDTSNYEHWTFQILPDFFENTKFYLGTDLLTSIVDMLKRYILAYKGYVFGSIRIIAAEIKSLSFLTRPVHCCSDVLDDIDNVNYIISGDTRYKEVSNVD